MIAFLKKNPALSLILLFAFAALATVTCNPFFLRLFWLQDGEIAAVTNFSRTVIPYLVFGILLIYAVRHKFRIRYGALFLIVLVYSAPLISSLINGVSLQRFAFAVRLPAVTYCLTLLYAQDEENWKRFIRVSSVVFLFMAIVNLFYMKVAVPLIPSVASVAAAVEAETFFGGHHNLVGFILSTGMLLCMLDRHYTGQKWLLILYSIFYAVNLYVCSSATGTITGAILLLYVCLPVLRRLVERVSSFWFLGAVLLLFVALMFFFEPFVNLAPVKYLVQNVLHKSLTFTGRFDFWPAIVEETLQRPILGFGMLPSNFFFDDVFNHTYVHAHNQFLQSWHEGGILGLIFPIGALAFTCLRLDRCKDKKLAGIFRIALFAELVALQCDQNVEFPWFVVLNMLNIALLAIPDETSRVSFLRQKESRVPQSQS